MAWGDNDFEQNLPDASAYDGPSHGFRTAMQADGIYWLIFFIVFTIFVLALAWVMGQWRGGRRLQAMRRDSVDFIYEHIQYHIEQTLKSQGASMIDNARELAAVVDGRLSAVMAVEAQQGKMIKALKKALDGEAEAEKPKSNKVKAAMSVDEQRVAIWEAVHNFNTFWSDKARVYELLEMAQIELFQTPEDHVERLSVIRTPKPIKAPEGDTPAPSPDSEPPLPEKALKGKGPRAKTKKSWLRAAKSGPAAGEKA